MSSLEFVPATLEDALAQPLLTELAQEYAQRYERPAPEVLAWLKDNPADEFSPPDGGMLIGLLDGRPVTGGGFRRLDAETAELKRIWTDREHRRRGYAMALLTELEAEIATRGYKKIYLMTGDRQPEAEELYAATGYTRLDAPRQSDAPVFPIAFEKRLA
ncbi:GNAT family N-acetyltransferase [Mycobacterium sherrisii]|uniref:GNAT family N-acetyltransferase n=1 Tax=Mycobacterium sherrisii TaxID=243061 RepID=UPI000AABD860|nr:GNAT family N-acetyltransferase [Mycobacterium sherrisii]MCV7031215.1 GNAT family N-acetyltransferase [Mycobacterium sherrisii]MEC4763621.1 GNAT family N-acetyltransferase [Mycobacterium sherrisii]